MIEAEPAAWVRLAAIRSQDLWIVRLLEVTTGKAPAHWKRVRWEYPHAVFLASRRKGTTVAKWLRTRRAVIRPYRLSFQEMSSIASWERRESRWSEWGMLRSLTWPTEVWRISRTEDTTHPTPSSELISPSAPSFISFEAASACLLEVDFDRWNRGGDFFVRWQDTRGRLLSVTVRPTELQARVDGHSLNGTVVELAGNNPGPSVELTTGRPRTVSFALARGLPEGAWVLLRHRNEWLDRRLLRWPRQSYDEDDVEFILEPETRLEVLIASGEGPTTDFKEELPGSSDDSKRKSMKTVGAFANGDGGSLIFGVTDEGQVVGLELRDASSSARDRLAAIVRSWVAPLPRFAIETLPVPDNQDRRVLVLTVEPGDQPLYAVGTQPSNYRYYVRRGGNSFQIGPGEVASLVQARTPRGARDTHRLLLEK
jgi:Putative DNA-binding domain